jgi:hypothetical protein
LSIPEKSTDRVGEQVGSTWKLLSRRPSVSAELIESELFGHEKGAFTGTVDRKIGRAMYVSFGTSSSAP